VRVYLASTLPSLAAALTAGSLESPLGFAVTPALREWYTEGDDEELEYAATTAAARASLRRLAGTDGAFRRVVLAADVADGSVRPAPDIDRAAVRLRDPVDLSQIASALVDDPAAVPDVRQALVALAMADAGDEDAAFTVDAVEDHELGWYAAQELSALVALET
jgi:hypothetical protein